MADDGGESEGKPWPLGCSWSEVNQSYNFALYSKHAIAVTLLLYNDRDFAIPNLVLPFAFPRNKTGRVWHQQVSLRQASGARYYAYQVDGPFDPDHGDRFDRDKILLDPYAKGVFFPPAFSREAAIGAGSNAGKAPLGVLPDRLAAPFLGRPRAPRHGHDLIIYEMHVRGFTRRSKSNVREEERGTFAGVVATNRQMATRVFPLHCYSRVHLIRVKELIFMSQLRDQPRARGTLRKTIVEAATTRLPSLMRPILGFRRNYLPLLMVYFAYGALGIIDVSRDIWIKERLTLDPAELAGIGVWLSLPWTVKMVFGQLVDSVPIFGSQRRSYILIGAVFTACGLLTLAGAAGAWIAFARADRLYILGAMLIVVGTVVQDVVADAMSTEVVSRVDLAGNARPEDEIRTELGMVQVLGRLALGIGILAVAGLSGWLAQFFGRETVFFLGLVIPAISALGVLLIRSESIERRPLDWRFLGGGMGFGLIVLAVALSGLPFAQELIFFLSMLVICTMLFFVTRELDTKTRRAILFASIIIFAFRATPSVGDGYFWWTLDVLKFDEAFYGSLRQTAAIIAIAAMWILSKQLTEYSVTKVLFWLAVAGAILSLPNISLFYGFHYWTEETFGFGARAIAVIDAAAASPFAQLSMIPLLTLIAFYAPAGHRATWFALMASLMNLALVAGQLQTKYLNQVFVVQRGDYSELGPLLITAAVLGFILPIGAILFFGRRA